MGWGSLLGDFAKGFAQGYIEERGIKGTLEDVGDLAKGLFSDKGSDNDLDVDAFWNQYNQLIENDQNAEARSFVKDVYKQYGMEDDYLFYYLHAQTCNFEALNCESSEQALELCRQAYKYIKNAIWKADDNDSKNEARELEKTISENIEFFKDRVDDFDNFTKALEEIDNYKNAGRFNDAERSLDSYYKNSKIAEIDYLYWDIKFGIHDECVKKTHEIDLSVLENDIQQMRRYANDDDREKLEENEKEYNLIKSFKLWTDAKDRAEKFAENNEFDRALTEMTSYYATQHNKESDFNYWLDLFRYTRLWLNYDMDRGFRILDRLPKLAEYLAHMRSCGEGSRNAVLEGASRMYDELVRKSKDNENKTSSSSNASLTVAKDGDSEKEYIDELKACYADDGNISDRERRLLEKLRKSLGISEERAKELEVMCNPNVLTPEEQEYADEIKVCLEDDGVISERERRLLTKLSNSLGIPKERALEIEKMVVNS